MPLEATPIENPFTTGYPGPGEKVPGSPGAMADEMSGYGQTTAAVVADAKDTVGSDFYNPAGRVRGQAGSRPDRKVMGPGTRAGTGSLVKDHPLTMAAIAIGGGIAIATILAHRKLQGLGQGRGALDTIKYALIGLAATKASNAIDRVIPGFTDHLQRYEETINATPWSMLTPESARE
jgi:hypothetical protein